MADVVSFAALTAAAAEAEARFFGDDPATWDKWDRDHVPAVVAAVLRMVADDAEARGREVGPGGPRAAVALPDYADRLAELIPENLRKI